MKYLLMLVFLLFACAPSNTDTNPSEYIEDLTTTNDLVWKAKSSDAEPIILKAIREFNKRLEDSSIYVLQPTGLVVKEIQSVMLEAENVLVLLAFQETNTVLGVFDLKDSYRTNTTSFAAQLEMVVVKAMDAVFERSKL